MMQTRKAPRLQGYDYSQRGAYFVTICAADKQSLFGTMRISAVGADAHIGPLLEHPSTAEGKAHVAPYVELTPIGEIVEKHLRSVPGMEKYVVMPDHVHFLVSIADGPMWASAPTTVAVVMSLPKLVRSFKTLSTKAAGRPLWQRGYYDHIIRDENDFLRCWRYIDENPARWEDRRED